MRIKRAKRMTIGTDGPSTSSGGTVKHRAEQPLSTELLLEVFLFLKGDADERQKAYNWIGITLVCRQWREIALSCPKMWNFVSTEYGVKGIRHLLKLCKSEPIIALIRPARKLKQTNYSRDKAFDFIKGMIGNVRELIIVYSSTFKPLLKLHPEELSCVDSLKIYSDSSEDHQAKCSQVPARLFEHRIQTLEKLWINVPFDSWHSAIFTNLTEIEISQADFQAVVKPSFENLWNILERCPELVVLSLIGCLPADQTESAVRQAAVRQPIPLLYLQHFRIHQSSLKATLLFESVLDIPKSTIRYFNLSLGQHITLGGRDEWPFSVMREGLLSSNGIRGTDADIESRHLKINYNGFRIEMQLTTTLLDLDIEFTSILHILAFKKLDLKHIAPVLHILHWDDITELEVVVEGGIDLALDGVDSSAYTDWCSWRSVFEFLPDLVSVTFRIEGSSGTSGDCTDHYAWNIIRALSNISCRHPISLYPLDFLGLRKVDRNRLAVLYDIEDADPCSLEPLCPCLEELSIQSNAISCLAPGENKTEGFWRFLNDFLEKRNERGYPILKLALQKEDEHTDIAKARGLVGKLKLDF